MLLSILLHFAVSALLAVILRRFLSRFPFRILLACFLLGCVGLVKRLITESYLLSDEHFFVYPHPFLSFVEWVIVAVPMYLFAEWILVGLGSGKDK